MKDLVKQFILVHEKWQGISLRMCMLSLMFLYTKWCNNYLLCRNFPRINVKESALQKVHKKSGAKLGKGPSITSAGFKQPHCASGPTAIFTSDSNRWTTSASLVPAPHRKETTAPVIPTYRWSGTSSTAIPSSVVTFDLF